MEKQRRTGVSWAQRRALRRHAAENPSLGQRDLAVWFHNEFQRVIPQSTVSESLGPKFAHLDDHEESALDQRQRFRPAQWPELEEALYEWFHHFNGPITGDILKGQAARFWRMLPVYQGMEVPTFSNSWLQRFKQRHGIGQAARVGKSPANRGAVRSVPRPTVRPPMDLGARNKNRLPGRSAAIPDQIDVSTTSLAARLQTEEAYLSTFGVAGPSEVQPSLTTPSQPPPRILTHQQALEALQGLRRYDMQQRTGSHAFMAALDKHEAVIKQRMAITTPQKAATTCFYESSGLLSST